MYVPHMSTSSVFIHSPTFSDSTSLSSSIISLPWVHPLSYFLRFIHCPISFRNQVNLYFLEFTHLTFFKPSIDPFPQGSWPQLPPNSSRPELGQLQSSLQHLHISSRKHYEIPFVHGVQGIGPFPSSSIVPLSTKISQVHPLSQFSRKLV